MPGTFAVCRWPAAAALPAWVHQREFGAFTRTPTELSAVCAFDAVPPGTVCEGPWRMLAVRG